MAISSAVGFAGGFAACYCCLFVWADESDSGGIAAAAAAAAAAAGDEIAELNNAMYGTSGAELKKAAYKAAARNEAMYGSGGGSSGGVSCGGMGGNGRGGSDDDDTQLGDHIYDGASGKYVPERINNVVPLALPANIHPPTHIQPGVQETTRGSGSGGGGSGSGSGGSELHTWLGAVCGLKGKNLEVAIAACDRHLLESVDDLRELSAQRKISQVFEQAGVQIAIERALQSEADCNLPVAAVIADVVAAGVSNDGAVSNQIHSHNSAAVI
jgi:hypothetical protein